MQIPSSFKLFGQTISVAYDPQILQEHDAYGIAEYRSNRIRIMPSVPGYPRTPEQDEQVFLHELIHYIFYYSGNEALHEDENLVNLCSGLLHQFFQTAEYGKHRPGKNRKKNT